MPQPIAKVQIFKQSFTFDQIAQSLECGTGFCVDCGKETQRRIDPNTERAVCDCCGANAVYGAESIIFIGVIK